MRLRRAATACVATLVLALVPARVQAEAPPVAAAPAPEVSSFDALLGACSKMPGLHARFTEEKQIALLSVPLRSSGTVHFTRGRGLVRHTLGPARQSVLVTDKELVFWDGKATKRLSLATSETVETFARVFTMILAADRAGLERSFALDFRARDAGWTLSLVPKAPALKGVISAIELEGRGNAVSLLVVREASGDVSTTRFSDVDTSKRYGDEEARRVFQLPPS